MNFTILRFETIDSTNTEALNQARRGAGEGLCVTARRQTPRVAVERVACGSLKKTPGFFSASSSARRSETRFLPLVTLAAAIAVHETLETLYQIDCDIKWVNDIHVRGKKSAEFWRRPPIRRKVRRSSSASE
jgi:BirA family biotin operon repressor/biotin-[acetyl-CoA-carboxylase] ligase